MISDEGLEIRAERAIHSINEIIILTLLGLGGLNLIRVIRGLVSKKPWQEHTDFRDVSDENEGNNHCNIEWQ